MDMQPPQVTSEPPNESDAREICARDQLQQRIEPAMGTPSAVADLGTHTLGMPLTIRTAISSEVPSPGGLWAKPSTWKAADLARSPPLVQVPENQSLQGTHSNLAPGAGNSMSLHGKTLQNLRLSGDEDPQQYPSLPWNASFTGSATGGSEDGGITAIPCFGDYVACAFLGRSLAEVPYRNHDDITGTYHGLFMLGQLYLMKDIRKLHECMKDFQFKRVVKLFETTKQQTLKAMQRWPFEGPHGPISRTMSVPSNGVQGVRGTGTSLASSTFGPSASVCLRSGGPGNAGGKGQPSKLVKDMESRHSQQMVHRMVVDIMKELEACAFEYLSYNWHRAEELFRVNQDAMEEVGILTTQSSETVPMNQRRRISCPALHDMPFGTKVSSSIDSESPKDAVHVSSVHSAPILAGETNNAGRRVQELRSHSETGTSALLSSAVDDAEWRRERARANWQRGWAAANKKVTMDMLGFTRKSKTLKEVFDSLKTKAGRQRHGEVLQSTLQPASTSKDPNRQPTLLLLGGGMAAGKSTVRDVIGQSDFWSKVGSDAVVVEADALKTDNSKDWGWGSLLSVVMQGSSSSKPPVSKSQNSFKNDSFSHEYSTKAAEAILVAAINEQKDIIFDGTMSWAPFVEQTIAMARDHNNAYVCGPGYIPASDGSPAVERYWEPLPADEQRRFLETHPDRRPYRIELVGVTCDPGLAVSRGLWRYLTSGRSVPIAAQLRSHKIFAENFERYTKLVDSATLYFTGCALTNFNKGHMNITPQVIAHSSSATWGEIMTNDAAYRNFKLLANINDQAPNRSSLCHGREDGGSPCSGQGPEICDRKTVPRSKEPRVRGLRAAFLSLERLACKPEMEEERLSRTPSKAEQKQTQSPLRRLRSFRSVSPARREEEKGEHGEHEDQESDHSSWDQIDRALCESTQSSTGQLKRTMSSSSLPHSPPDIGCLDPPSPHLSPKRVQAAVSELYYARHGENPAP